jgi:hypothetical protein
VESKNITRKIKNIMARTYGRNVIKKLTKKDDINVIKPIATAIMAGMSELEKNFERASRPYTIAKTKTKTAKSYKPKAGKFIILSS